MTELRTLLAYDTSHGSWFRHAQHVGRVHFFSAPMDMTGTKKNPHYLNMNLTYLIISYKKKNKKLSKMTTNETYHLSMIPCNKSSSIAAARQHRDNSPCHS